MSSPSIAVIGLGYVGLPLAWALSCHYSVTAYDLSETRIAELKDNHDRTGEVEPIKLRSAKLDVTGDPKDIEGADYFIIAVPTPADSNNRPDLEQVTATCRTAGKGENQPARV